MIYYYYYNNNYNNNLQQRLSDQEVCTSVKAFRAEMLKKTTDCYQQASDCEAEDQEEWLHHYMLGKVAEKEGKSPEVYLEHYTTVRRWRLWMLPCSPSCTCIIFPYARYQTRDRSGWIPCVWEDDMHRFCFVSRRLPGTLHQGEEMGIMDTRDAPLFSTVCS